MMPQRKTPLKASGSPLPRRKALRRDAVVAAFHAATAAPRRRKTTVGEFTAKQRKTMYARWDGRCVVCGDWMHPGLYVCQHRVARGSGGSRDPRKVHITNGIAIHQVPCHERIEANPDAAERLGYRVRQGQHPRDWELTTWTGRRVLLLDDGGWRPV